jgi:heterogeneous nuclear rnp K-like protein 2
MPDADSNRKRSRSPSDSEQQQHHKRANTGPTTNTNDSASKSNLSSGSAVPAAASMSHDVTMVDAPHSTHDTAASTPSCRDSSDRAKEDATTHNTDEPAKNTSTSTSSAAPSSSTPAPAAMIHMRCLIVTQDASIIIGKGGSHVNEIRERSGARVMVSESIPGNPERILNVSGPLDAVSKVSRPPTKALCGSTCSWLAFRPLD